MTLKFIAIFVMAFASFCLVLSIVIYAINRAKYYELLNLFQKSHTFPAPYSFHCLVGFFGAAPMVYFFINLKKKKKVFFLDKNSDAYGFFNRENVHLTRWMSGFYYVWIASLFCYSFLFIVAIFLEFRSRYFP